MTKITVEVRRPKTHEEKKCLGSCVTEGNQVRVFLDDNQNASQGFNTYVHELVHAYLHLIEARLTTESQEDVCRAVGNAAEEVFTKFFRLR